MVDPISTPQGRPRIARPGEDMGAPNAAPIGTTAQGQTSGPATTSAAAPKGDSVTLSPAAQTMPSALKEAGPPMDLEIVRKIKEAIAEGRYPIDVEAITESLFQDYLELVK